MVMNGAAEKERTIMCYLRPAPNKKEPEGKGTYEAIRRTAIRGGVTDLDSSYVNRL